jgi:hypothetical protein
MVGKVAGEVLRAQEFSTGSVEILLQISLAVALLTYSLVRFDKC